MEAMLVGDVSPHNWAISVSFGVAAGLFPIIGPVGILSLLVIWLFRMHLPLVMLLVYGLYPLQLALMVPFGMVGKWMLPSQNTAYFENSSSLSWLNAVGDWAMAAFVGWLLLMLPLSLICYRVALKFAQRKKNF